MRKERRYRLLAPNHLWLVPRQWVALLPWSGLTPMSVLLARPAWLLQVGNRPGEIVKLQRKPAVSLHHHLPESRHPVEPLWHVAALDEVRTAVRTPRRHLLLLLLLQVSLSGLVEQLASSCLPIFETRLECAWLGTAVERYVWRGGSCAL